MKTSKPILLAGCVKSFKENKINATTKHKEMPQQSGTYLFLRWPYGRTTANYLDHNFPSSTQIPTPSVTIVLEALPRVYRMDYSDSRNEPKSDHVDSRASNATFATGPPPWHILLPRVVMMLFKLVFIIIWWFVVRPNVTLPLLFLALWIISNNPAYSNYVHTRIHRLHDSAYSSYFRSRVLRLDIPDNYDKNWVGRALDLTRNLRLAIRDLRLDISRICVRIGSSALFDLGTILVIFAAYLVWRQGTPLPTAPSVTDEHEWVSHPIYSKQEPIRYGSYEQWLNGPPVGKAPRWRNAAKEPAGPTVTVTERKSPSQHRRYPSLGVFKCGIVANTLQIYL